MVKLGFSAYISKNQRFIASMFSKLPIAEPIFSTSVAGKASCKYRSVTGKSVACADTTASGKRRVTSVPFGTVTVTL